MPGRRFVTWTHGTGHVYEITVSLPSSAPDAAQGQSAQGALTWQAQSS